MNLFIQLILLFSIFYFVIPSGEEYKGKYSQLGGTSSYGVANDDYSEEADEERAKLLKELSKKKKPQGGSKGNTKSKDEKKQNKKKDGEGSGHKTSKFGGN